MEPKVAQVVLIGVQVVALGKAKTDQEAHERFKNKCPRYCGAKTPSMWRYSRVQDTSILSRPTSIDTDSTVGI